MACEKITNLKKYRERPGPPFAAQECKGRVAIGNDGKKYKSVAATNGVFRWKLNEKAASAIKRKGKSASAKKGKGKGVSAKKGKGKGASAKKRKGASVKKAKGRSSSAKKGKSSIMKEALKIASMMDD